MFQSHLSGAPACWIGILLLNVHRNFVRFIWDGGWRGWWGGGGIGHLCLGSHTPNVFGHSKKITDHRQNNGESGGGELAGAEQLLLW